MPGLRLGAFDARYAHRSTTGHPRRDRRRNKAQRVARRRSR